MIFKVAVSEDVLKFVEGICESEEIEDIAGAIFSAGFLEAQAFGVMSSSDISMHIFERRGEKVFRRRVEEDDVERVAKGYRGHRILLEHKDGPVGFMVTKRKLRKVGRIVVPMISCIVHKIHVFEEAMKLGETFEKRARDREFELEVLSDVARETLYILEPEKVFDAISSSLEIALKCNAVGVVGTERLEEKLHISLQEGIVRSKDSKLATSFKKKLRETFELIKGKRRSIIPEKPVMLTAPIIIGGELEGMMGMAFEEGKQFSEANVRFFSAIANFISASFERLVSIGERERRRFETLIDSLEDGMVLVSSKGRIKSANRLGRELFSKVIKDESIIEMTSSFGVRSLFEERVGDRIYQVKVIPVEGKDVLITMRDATEERVMQTSMFQTAKLASLGELAAGIAHEINNPIQIICGFSELIMRRNDIPGEVRKWSKLINETGRRASQITQDLLLFARGVGEKTLVNLSELVKRVLRIVSGPYTRNGVKVTFKAETGDDIISANPNQLQQVIFNLVQNAYEAIMEGREGGCEGCSEIKVKVGRIDEMVSLEVEDDGPGVPEGIRYRIFDPFFTTKEKGTGLGLSLSYRIVVEHGGEMRLLEGKGARFLVLLPCAGN